MPPDIGSASRNLFVKVFFNPKEWKSADILEPSLPSTLRNLCLFVCRPKAVSLYGMSTEVPSKHDQDQDLCMYIKLFLTRILGKFFRDKNPETCLQCISIMNVNKPVALDVLRYLLDARKQDCRITACRSSITVFPDKKQLRTGYSVVWTTPGDLDL